MGAWGCCYDRTEEECYSQTGIQLTQPKKLERMSAGLKERKKKKKKQLSSRDVFEDTWNESCNTSNTFLEKPNN